MPDTAPTTAGPAGPPPPMGSEPGGSEPGAPEPAAPAHKASPVRSIVEWGLIIGGALVVALVIRAFLVQSFYIPSPSMVPTLKVKDRVLVNKLSYHLHDIHRGDVVVFKKPPHGVDPNIKDLIKRVIGLPGDTVEGRNGHVYINGRLLDEPYLPSGVVTDRFAPITVPKGQIWVMGDNREDSADSRVFGTISEKLVVGRAFARIWPLSNLGFL
jgi:signal peptidase I